MWFLKYFEFKKKVVALTIEKLLHIFHKTWPVRQCLRLDTPSSQRQSRQRQRCAKNLGFHLPLRPSWRIHSLSAAAVDFLQWKETFNRKLAAQRMRAQALFLLHLWQWENSVLSQVSNELIRMEWAAWWGLKNDITLVQRTQLVLLLVVGLQTLIPQL